jgi:peptidoglycan glycosyltransferase
MRRVVTEGTGARFLAGAQPAIAGKTGTAEVKDKASHSWFIGFAPYEAHGGRRIAFGVIVEHGGYGGRLAAPAAGEIVRAAAAMGIIH